MHDNRGFNLLELLVAIAIVVIIAAIAVPSFTSLIIKIQMDGYAKSFRNSINLATSESIKRGVNVTVCSSNVSLTDCDNNSYWENGWLVKETIAVAGRESIIFKHEAFSSNYSFRGDATDNKYSITFTPSGINTGNGIFVLCKDAEVDENTKSVVISRFGKTSVHNVERYLPDNCQKS